MKRNVWPYAIIGYFVVFIPAMVTWIAFAVKNDDELVRPDYYEHEIKYQQQINRVARTRALNAQATVSYSIEKRSISIALPKEHVSDYHGTIHLYRASSAKLDQSIPLKLAADGTQTVDTASLEEGQWKVRVNWTAGGEDYYLEKAVIF